MNIEQKSELANSIRYASLDEAFKILDNACIELPLTNEQMKFFLYQELFESKTELNQLEFSKPNASTYTGIIFGFVLLITLFWIYFFVFEHPIVNILLAGCVAFILWMVVRIAGLYTISNEQIWLRRIYINKLETIIKIYEIKI